MSGSYKKFLLLWFAGLISATGSGMTAFALGIYIYQKTGMSSMTGLLLLLGFLPGLLLTPLAGVLADRYDRRLLMMAGDGLSVTGLVIILLSAAVLQGRALIPGICLGVAVSSVFSSLVEPAFRATVSDLLEKSDYSKASGMMQLVSSARYLLSPVPAGLILSRSGIHTVILLDILTVLLTLPVTFFVRREMKRARAAGTRRLTEDLRLGLDLIRREKGILMLIWFGVLVSFCLGTVQTLMTPMILSFADEAFLGFATTFSACGMLAGGLFLGSVKIRKGFPRILCLSLLFAGFCMIGFSAGENRSSVCAFGFCLFSALPFANAAIDYLMRTNIPQTHQGKVWGLTGIFSQTGYIFAYASAGAVADNLTGSLLSRGGALPAALGRIIGVSPGRGAALVIMAAGVLLAAVSLILPQRAEIRKLEDPNVLETV